MSNLKNKLDKLDFEKLIPVIRVTVDLSKLSDVVKTNVFKYQFKKYFQLIFQVFNVFKKTEYHESVKKVNNIKAIDTCDLV